MKTIKFLRKRSAVSFIKRIYTISFSNVILFKGAYINLGMSINNFLKIFIEGSKIPFFNIEIMRKFLFIETTILGLRLDRSTALYIYKAKNCKLLVLFTQAQKTKFKFNNI